MARKPRAYVTALPLSALPDLQQLLAPFLGGKGPREHVVMVRVGEEGAQRLDELVEAGLFGSRSEAAAFLIGAGIQAQRELFARIASQTSEIKRLRDSLRQTALDTLSAAAAQAPPEQIEPPEPNAEQARPRSGRKRGGRTKRL
ncbi:MAG TPA: hypothetical protein VHR45_01030 [Thermoanaerobaculia bacterium]|nr:hypothetical protein [Thermoanaerobaculia bacterium]